MFSEVDLLGALAVKSSGSATGARRRPKFRASVVATFNAYLPFYEDVILRRLVASGCQHNILLMDLDQWQKELSGPMSRPRLAGTANRNPSKGCIDVRRLRLDPVNLLA